MLRITLFFVCCPAALPLGAANWQVTLVNHLLLTPPAGITVAEMSGVTYVGQTSGNHRFIAAEETKGEFVQFDLTLSPGGAITEINNIAAIDIAPTLNLDFEGIAYTNPSGHSVFVSDENGPGLREVSLGQGVELQSIPVPSVFTNRRGNLGFESLTRTVDGTVMYTANEQALTVDGPAATASTGTNVRLLKLNVAGDSVAVGPQFVYQVEPIHGTNTFGAPQSGLSDLVAMPDGTVLALERSVSLFAQPSTYLSRIYEIRFGGATDVSVGPTANGLIGQSFTPVSKQLLWSGPADGTNGQNLEGVTLGPRLANGDWLLIGVVDDGDELSNNTIVAFTASPVLSADFDDDGDTDGADFLNWQRGLGKNVGALHAEGDADRDGDIDALDLLFWKKNFSSSVGVAGESTAAAVPEPACIAMTCTVFGAATQWRKRQRRHREKPA